MLVNSRMCVDIKSMIRIKLSRQLCLLIHHDRLVINCQLELPLEFLLIFCVTKEYKLKTVLKCLHFLQAYCLDITYSFLLVLSVLFCQFDINCFYINPYDILNCKMGEQLLLKNTSVRRDRSQMILYFYARVIHKIGLLRREIFSTTQIEKICYFLCYFYVSVTLSAKPVCVYLDVCALLYLLIYGNMIILKFRYIPDYIRR